jgi:hypothetical protein
MLNMFIKREGLDSKQQQQQWLDTGGNKATTRLDMWLL